MSCNGCDGNNHGVVTAMKALAIGAYKVAKAALGADPVPLPVLQERRAICSSCEKAVPCMYKKDKKCWCGPVWDGIWGTRETCGCNLEWKTLLASESCPIGKWPAVAPRSE